MVSDDFLHLFSLSGAIGGGGDGDGNNSTNDNNGNGTTAEATALVVTNKFVVILVRLVPLVPVSV